MSLAGDASLAAGDRGQGIVSSIVGCCDVVRVRR